MVEGEWWWRRVRRLKDLRTFIEGRCVCVVEHGICGFAYLLVF